jgi:hypothetical protein
MTGLYCYSRKYQKENAGDDPVPHVAWLMQFFPELVSGGAVTKDKEINGLPKLPVASPVRKNPVQPQATFNNHIAAGKPEIFIFKP